MDKAQGGVCLIQGDTGVGVLILPWSPCCLILLHLTTHMLHVVHHSVAWCMDPTQGSEPSVVSDSKHQC
jgi:hypothetical protein